MLCERAMRLPAIFRLATCKYPAVWMRRSLHITGEAAQVYGKPLCSLCDKLASAEVREHGLAVRQCGYARGAPLRINEQASNMLQGTLIEVQL